ncbi:transcription initiation factor IIB [Methanobrevibacter sp.]|uniref:transcription initiation factor IIB n=1 Tax=Methanobrevibacter sp. TaxID=66852 RepID=UPI00388F587D
MKNKRSLKKSTEEDINHMPENICPECNSTDLDYNSSRAELTCKRCGLVIDENIIDHGPEWRAFNPEQRNSRARTGAPLRNGIHDFGLGADIDWKNNNISSKNVAKYYRMRKWNKKLRVSGSRDRSLAFALTQINNKCSSMGLPNDVRENASLIYRKALENRLIIGRTVEGVVSASIYIACRQCNIPRTLAEIAVESSASKKQIARIQRSLARELKIKLTPPSPSDYIPRFATELELSGKSQAKAIKIAEQSKNRGLANGKGPNGIAAAALYIASLMVNERKSQRDIAEVAGVTEVTLRNRYKELSENLNLALI